MAATAAAALKLGTYRMPPEEGGGALQRHHASSNGKRPQKVATERHLARRKHKDWQPNAVQVSNSAVTGGGGGKPRAADLMDDPATELSLDDSSAGPPTSDDAALFVHFIPPPLRKPSEPHLAWIVHTCDGGGCKAAKHVVRASWQAQTPSQPLLITARSNRQTCLHCEVLREDAPFLTSLPLLFLLSPSCRSHSLSIPSLGLARTRACRLSRVPASHAVVRSQITI